MARIRTIKPEFPQSESIGRLSREARLCFIQLWTIADDEGRLRGSSRMLASLLYPYDDDAPRLIDEWLSELEREPHIRRYEVGDHRYIEIVNWKSHQKIDHASKSKIPPFSKPPDMLANSREELDKDSVGRDQGRDQGKEGERARSAPPQSMPPKFEETADEPPEGLSELEYGRGFCESLSIPIRRSHDALVEVAGATVTVLSREEGCPAGEACRRLIQRARDHPAEAGKWRFWLQDGAWRQVEEVLNSEAWEK